MHSVLADDANSLLPVVGNLAAAAIAAPSRPTRVWESSFLPHSFSVRVMEILFSENTPKPHRMVPRIVFLETYNKEPAMPAHDVSDLSPVAKLPQGAAKELGQAAIKFTLSGDEANVETLLGSGSLQGVNRDVINRAFPAMSHAILDAARSNSDGEALRMALVDAGIAADHAAAVVDLYKAHREALRKHLGRSGFGPSWLTGVTWRLDHVVKSRHLDDIHSPLFFVKIITTQADGSEKVIAMACNHEQMQDLHDRLSDAVKQKERTVGGK